MALAGPSMKRNADDVQHQRQRRRQRQAQRRWIQLIDAWTHAGANVDDRVALLEQITHHSQVIVKTVADRDWLLVAFQMAISAVLFPADEGEVSSDAPQLGTQLLQLAIHSVCRPYLAHLTDPQHARTVKQALVSFEQIVARLAVYDTLGGLTEMLALPPLPLELVLTQDAASLLSTLAVLPQASDLLPSLLRRHPRLLVESAPLRLSVLAQLIRSAGLNSQTLAASGLLIGWRNGAETSIWADTTADSPLDLDTLAGFYTEQVASLCEIACEAEARALCTVLRAELQGPDAQVAVQRVEAAIDSPAEHTAQTRQSVVDVTRIRALALSAPALSESKEQRTQVAATALSRLTPSSAAADLVQMVDVADSATLRSHILSIMSQLSLPPAQMTALFVAVLYARPAAGAFRIDVTCSSALLTHFLTTATELRKQGSPSTDSTLSTMVRSALDADAASIVPACQLYAHATGTLDAALRHLTWLTAIGKLMEPPTGAALAKGTAIDVCWLAAYGGASALADKQEQALVQLIETFAAAFPAAPSHNDRGGFDVASLRVKAAWTTFFQDALTLCGGADVPMGALTSARSVELLLSGVLRTGDVELFRTLASEASVTQALSPDEIESLVLTVSIELYDRASVGSMRNKEMKLAMDLLDAVPGGTRVQTQRSFIEATCRLCSFKLKSRWQPGTLMEPREVRATPDRMDLVARLLATQEDAYRSPELVLDIATKLTTSVGVGAGSTASLRTLVEVRTLAMLADSATSSDNFDEAAAFCHRLVDKVNILRTRTAGGAATPAADLLASATELGWKSCYQLSKHPGWDDTPSRITMLAHALTLCPAPQLQSMLKQWSSLDQQLVTELEQGKQFSSTKKAAAGWLNINPSATAASAAGQQHLTAQNAATTAASVGAGLVGMGANAAANLLPLSFSPLSYFNTHTQQQQTVGTGASGQQAEMNRAAKLFDFDQQPQTYAPGMDPTERAVRAARAARDFLGWKSSQQPGSDDSANASATRGSGFSLSKGVGWLIGEEKH